MSGERPWKAVDNMIFISALCVMIKHGWCGLACVSILQMDADALLPIQRVKLAFVAVFC